MNSMTPIRNFTINRNGSKNVLIGLTSPSKLISMLLQLFEYQYTLNFLCCHIFILGAT